MVFKFFLILILILIIIIIFYLFNSRKDSFDTETAIPKIIYTYWNSDIYPKSIEYCIKSIKETNPTWELHIMNNNDIPEEVKHLSYVQQSDYIRLNKLSKTGGVWLDASIVCINKIENWIDMNSNSIQGFRVPMNNSYTMESWAFAVPRNSKFCKLWFREFKKAVQSGFDAYCNSIPTDNISTDDGLRNFLPYLTIHAAWRVAYYKLPKSNIILLESCDGPFKYLCMHHGSENSAQETVKTLLQIPIDELEKPLPVIIKIRGAEREYLDPMLDNKSYDKKSLLAKVWKLT